VKFLASHFWLISWKKFLCKIQGWSQKTVKISVQGWSASFLGNSIFLILAIKVVRNLHKDFGVHFMRFLLIIRALSLYIGDFVKKQLLKGVFCTPHTPHRGQLVKFRLSFPHGSSYALSNDTKYLS